MDPDIARKIANRLEGIENKLEDIAYSMQIMSRRLTKEQLEKFQAREEEWYS